MNRTRAIRRTTSALVACAYVLTTSVIWVPGARAGSVDDMLRSAQDSFLYGDYAEAASEVLQLIEQGGLSPAELREAHVLAAQCYLELGDEAAVDAAICAAHGADPLWQPSSAVMTEREVIRFGTALRGCPEAVRSTPRAFPALPDPATAEPNPKDGAPPIPAAETGSEASSGTDAATDGEPETPSTPWFKRPVAWIVGGAAAVGVAVLALGGGGGGGNDPIDGPVDPTGIGDFPAAPED